MTHILGNFYITRKGYPRLHSGKYRGWYLHRAVFAEVAGRPPRDGFHVHHQGPKTCACPWQLIEVQDILHPQREMPRHPYTGRFLTLPEYFQLLKSWGGD